MKINILRFKDKYKMIKQFFFNDNIQNVISIRLIQVYKESKKYLERFIIIGIKFFKV